MRKCLGIRFLVMLITISMFCEHIAWRRMDFHTPLAQCFYIAGRIVMPIVCFMLVEETKQLKTMRNLISILFCLWIVSIFPYYQYTGGRFWGRQNLLFDMNIVLLMLTSVKAYRADKIRKENEIIVIGVLFFLSAIKGNCPVLPLLFSLTFYKNGINKRAIKQMILSTFLFVGCLIILSLLGVTTSGLEIKENWYDNLYYLGFLLAIPILCAYNGNGQEQKRTKHIFFFIYSINFLILSGMFNICEYSFYDYYIQLNVITIIVMVVFGCIAYQTKPSKAQLANIVLMIFAFFFMIGFYIELTTTELDVIYVACKIEYCGLVGMLSAFTKFTEYFYRAKFPRIVYFLQGSFSFLILYCVFTNDTNALFFKGIQLISHGNYVTIDVEPGILYYCFYIYVTLLYIGIALYCIFRVRRGEAEEKRRCFYILMGALSPCASMLIKFTGIAKDYDFMTFGVLGFILFFTVGLLRDDYFSKIQTENEMDSLTGVSNRRYFKSMVEMELSMRKKGTLIMLDMDNFKYINDTFGHGTGDKVLVTLGQSLKQAVSDSNYVARIGGDEFCIYLVNVIKRAELEEKVEALVNLFERNMKKLKLSAATTLSIGIATYYGKSEGRFENLYENADKALYLAKNSGKSQYQFYKLKE